MGIYKYYVKYWDEYECFTDEGIIIADDMNEIYNSIKRWVGDEIEVLNVECVMGTEDNVFSKSDVPCADWLVLKNTVDRIYEKAEAEEKLRKAGKQ